MSDSFLQALAKPRPDPGGGAAAAYAGTLGLALLEKVVRLEADRPPGTPGTPGWPEQLKRLRQVALALRRLQDEDVQAYDCLVKARQSGKAADLEAALREAVACPLRIVRQAKAGLGLIAETGAQCRAHLLADLLVAAELLHAALMGAYHIACANLALVRKPGDRASLARDLVQTCQPACALLKAVKTELVARKHDLDPGC
jgi:formiminotetrahydrofolate cyclodeaminase